MSLERETFKVFDNVFTINEDFQMIKKIKYGANGVVCSARLTDNGNDIVVAIKKMTNVFSNISLLRRSLRELKLLRHFRGHRNIVCLYDVDLFEDSIYLYEELMGCNLSRIISSGQVLTDFHVQHFIYQTLCALKFIHSAGVLHRDIKPSNMLVNEDCQLKLCDFGLARGYSKNKLNNKTFSTEFVPTRWYRAPEIILCYQDYSEAIDVWSSGCVLAELLGRTPLFNGDDYVSQLNRILQIMGTPPPTLIERIASKNVQEYIYKLGNIPTQSFRLLFPHANPFAINLLEHMLNYNPKKRITVNNALKHSYLNIWHDPDDEPICSHKFDFCFENVFELEQLRETAKQEVEDFRNFVREPVRQEHKNPSNPQRH